MPLFGSDALWVEAREDGDEGVCEADVGLYFEWLLRMLVSFIDEYFEEVDKLDFDLAESFSFGNDETLLDFLVLC